MAQSEIFFDWYGRYPTDYEKRVMGEEGWNESTIRRAAVGAVKRKDGFKNADGRALDDARWTVIMSLAPFFGGAENVPSTMVDGFVGEGATSDYLINVYGPRLRGVTADNPLAADFIARYVALTGRNPGDEALDRLGEIVRSHGFTDTGMAAWDSWVKTTDAAITGNWGAEHRANINNVVNNILGRLATEAELSASSSWWNLDEAALLEAVRGTLEWSAIYGNKPVWVTEGEFLNGAAGLEYVMRWAYGDRVIRNEDGSLTFPVGPSYVEPTVTQVVTEPDLPETPEWRSLTMPTFRQEIAKVGVTEEGGQYFKDGAQLTNDELLALLPSGEFYHDAQGFHYVQYEGATNPRTGKAAGVTKPAETIPRTQQVEMVTAPGGFGNFNFTYSTPDMVSDMFWNNYTPEMIMQEIRWGEEAEFLERTQGEIVTEAFGGMGDIDWYVVASGAIGSGAMRAQIMEANNRVAYREAYRQVFGSDPGPADYDRITNQFVSPGELIREHQAIESADEMYAEVNDLLQRVMGQTVSKAELKDMVLGRPNSGELRALINQATKLDQYRWVHKQYYGVEPAPDDYAHYAGYSGVSELQWEIVTGERIAELGPQIQEAWRRAYQTELSADDLKTMLGEMEGYGELRRKYTEAEEEVQKQETAVRAAHEEQKVEIAYTKSAMGGFETSLKPFAEL